MGVYIGVEDKRTEDVLRAILPAQVIEHCEFVSVTLARTYLVVDDEPCAFVLNTHTNDESIVLEKGQMNKALFGGTCTPYRICLAIPEIEVLLVQDFSLLERYFEMEFTEIEKDLSRLSPKRFLEIICGFDEGIFTSFLHDIYVKGCLGDVRENPLVKELCEFVLEMGGMD